VVYKVRLLLRDVLRLQAIALRADQFEAPAREIPSVNDGQTIGPIAEALRRDLEQLPLIQEKRVRNDRILYGHGKTTRKRGFPRYCSEHVLAGNQKISPEGNYLSGLGAVRVHPKGGRDEQQHLLQ